MKLWINIITGIVLLGLSLGVNAQISIAEHLKSSENDISLLTSQKKLDYLNGTPYSLPALQKVEFRTGNDRLNADDQDFALRLNPTNPWENKNTKRLFKAEENLINSEEQVAFKELLLARYEEAIDFIYLYESNLLNHQLKELIKKEETTLIKMSGSSSFKSSDLIDIKLEYINQLIEATEGELELGELNDKIKKLHSGKEPVNWLYSNIVSIARIDSFLAQYELGKNISSEVEVRSGRVEIASREMDLEKSKKNIGFLQGGFDPNRNEGDRVGLSIGIVLPIVNPNKADVAERKLDLIEEEGKLEQARLQSSSERALHFDKLKASISRIRLLDKEIEQIANTEYLHTLQVSDGFNPINTIKVRKGLLQLETLRIKMLQSLLQTYVDFLYVEDALQAKPLINYLDPLLSEL